MNLTRLVHYSQCNPSIRMNMPELTKTCARNNSTMNVTGILHYNGNAFLQVLEGGRAEVSSIYHRIADDPRHINIIGCLTCDAPLCGATIKAAFPFQI